MCSVRYKAAPGAVLLWYNKSNGGAIGNYLMTIPEKPLRRTEQYLNRIATGEGEIPSQPESRLEQYLEAIAEGGGGGIKILTSDDFNYPINNPTRIALWRLPEGIYTLQSSISVCAGDIFILDYTMNRGDITIVTNDPVSSYKTVYITHCNGSKSLIYKTSDGNSANVWNPPANVIDNLFSTNGNYALSANQGKVLNDKIGDLSTLTTTVKTSAVAAINELAQGGGGGGSIVTTLTSDDYNWDSTGQGGTPDAIAAWLLNSGWYIANNSLSVYISNDYTLDGTSILFYVDIQTSSAIVFGVSPVNGYLSYVTVDTSDGSIIDGITDQGELIPYMFSFIDDLTRLKQCPIIADTSPDINDAGALGQLWTDTDGMNTYQCTAIDDSDPSDIQYTWTLKF